MSASAFLDTNVLIYAFSESEPEKRTIARQLWLVPKTWISTQVINETCNVLSRKFRLPFADVAATIDQIVQTLPDLPQA
jgi:predicted nucleic acid-binding protein